MAEGEHKTLTLDKDERINEMVVWASLRRVVRLEIKTSLGKKFETPGDRGEGGEPFWACRADAKQKVKTIMVWHGPGFEGAHILKGLQLTWDDGTSTRVYGTPWTPESSLESFIFEEKEVITHMTLWTGTRVEKMQFSTSAKRSFEAGGKGGVSTTVSVASGKLVGFEGASKGEVDRPAPIFLAT